MSRLPSRFRFSPRPASMITQSRHCGVSWYARYPCQCRSLTARRFLRSRCAAPRIFNGLAPKCHSRTPSPRRASRTSRSRNSAASSGMHATPVEYRISTDRRFFRFPVRRRLQHARAANAIVGYRLHPHRSSLVQLQREQLSSLLPSRSRVRPRPISVFSQPRHCGRIYGLHATPARSRSLTARRSYASRSAGSFASRCGQTPGASDIARLHPHRTLLVQLRRGQLSLPKPHGPVLVPGPSRCSRNRDIAAMLWSACYPCQITVSDSPPGLTLPRCADALACRCGRSLDRQGSAPPSPSYLLIHSTALGTVVPIILTVTQPGQGRLGVIAAETLRHAVVCMLPLPGFGF